MRANRSCGVQEEPAALARLRGCSAAMRRLRRDLQQVAPTDASVLVLGESGCGKDLVAQALHALSRRRAGPYVAVNCGAIAARVIESELLGHERGSFTGADRRRAGYFEAACGGSLFLDEVSEMLPALQVKLLRVLETRRLRRVGGDAEIAIDVRVIAASNRRPAAAVRAGQLREDLLYRLAVVRLTVPPLRERPEDIPLLANDALDELNRQGGRQRRFSPRFLRMLSGCDWPGNVRELRNAVHRAYLLSDGLVELPAAALRETPPAPVRDEGLLRVAVGTRLDDCQRELVLATLAHCRQDRARCAAQLGISLRTLYSRLERYGHRGGRRAEGDFLCTDAGRHSAPAHRRPT